MLFFLIRRIPYFMYPVGTWVVFLRFLKCALHSSYLTTVVILRHIALRLKHKQNNNNLVRESLFLHIYLTFHELLARLPTSYSVSYLAMSPLIFFDRHVLNLVICDLLCHKMAVAKEVSFVHSSLQLIYNNFCLISLLNMFYPRFRQLSTNWYL